MNVREYEVEHITCLHIGRSPALQIIFHAFIRVLLYKILTFIALTEDNRNFITHNIHVFLSAFPQEHIFRFWFNYDSFIIRQYSSRLTFHKLTILKFYVTLLVFNPTKRYSCKFFRKFPEAVLYQGRPRSRGIPLTYYKQIFPRPCKCYIQ